MLSQIIGKICSALFRLEKRGDGKFDFNPLIFFIVLHPAALVGSYYFFTGRCGLLTYFWSKYF
jgi:hypothetical protein